MFKYNKRKRVTVKVALFNTQNVRNLSQKRGKILIFALQ